MAYEVELKTENSEEECLLESLAKEVDKCKKRVEGLVMAKDQVCLVRTLRAGADI